MCRPDARPPCVLQVFARCSQRDVHSFDARVKILEPQRATRRLRPAFGFRLLTRGSSHIRFQASSKLANLRSDSRHLRKQKSTISDGRFASSSNFRRNQFFRAAGKPAQPRGARVDRDTPTRGSGPGCAKWPTRALALRGLFPQQNGSGVA